MSLRQQCNWLLKFGRNADATNETTQQILCCDSSAALGMIKRKGTTRRTRHIELKAFFLQQWSARPEVRLVLVGTSKMLADLSSTGIQSNMKSSRGQIGTWSKRSSGGGCRNSSLSFVNFCGCYFFFLFLCGTHLTFYNELRVNVFLPTQFVQCSAILVTRHMSNCGQTPAVSDPDCETCLDTGAEDESYTSPSL